MASQGTPDTSVNHNENTNHVNNPNDKLQYDAAYAAFKILTAGQIFVPGRTTTPETDVDG